MPKKGDIVEIDYYDMRPENNKIAEIIEVTDIKHSTPFITLRFSDNDKYRCQRKEIKPLGLSLDRIKAEYVSREEQRKRDEKLNTTYAKWIWDNYKLIDNMSMVVLEERMKKEVFAEVDKQ